MVNRESVYEIENAKFQILYSDITLLPTDVIVSSDNNYISMSGGVSAAILRKAGQVLRDEVKKQLPLKIGDVAVTSAGKLKAKYIFHGITIDYENYVYADGEVIRSIVEKSLNLAEILNIKRISFPALGTGVANVPFIITAQIMVDSILKHLSTGSKIENVAICLYAREGVQQSDLNIFYETSVGLMSIVVQSNRLDILLSEMKELLNSIGRHDLIADLQNLKNKIKETNANITTKISDLENKIEKSNENNEDLNLSILKSLENDIKHHIEVKGFEDRQLEGKLLRTKLTGHQIILNIKQSQLNTYQIQEAKYGGILVPPILLATIDSLKLEMEGLERDIRNVRIQLSKLGNPET